MNVIYTQGDTLGQIKYPEGVSISVSILSHRAARLALNLSLKGKWRKPVSAYETFQIDDLLFVGFQYETGRHIAVVVKRNGRR